MTGNKKTFNLDRSVLIVGGVLSLLLVPLVVKMQWGRSATFETRWRRIAQMSAVERAELERNLRAYRRLSPAQRQKYQRLHRQLQEAARRNAGLQSTLAEYHRWLQTLSPWQRDQLRRTTDPEAKLHLVRRFKREQSEEATSIAPLLPAQWVRALKNGRALANRLPIKPQAFAAMMQLIEQEAPLRRDVREQFEGLSGFPRHVRLLWSVLEFREGNRWQWLDERLTDQLLGQLPDREPADRLLRLPPQRRKRVVGRLLAIGLLRELHRELQEHNPSEAELQNILDELDAETRRELIQLPPRHLQWRLHYLHWSRQRDGPPIQYETLRETVSRLIGPARG